MSRTIDAREVILTSTTGESWSAAVWDPRNGSLLSMFKSNGTLGHRTLQLLSDSYLIAANATSARLHIWPLNNSLPVPKLQFSTQGKVNALACTPDGSYIIAGIAQTLFIWQLCNGRQIAALRKHYQPIICISITKDGSLFASSGNDMLCVWSLYSALNDKNCSPVHIFRDQKLPIKDLYIGHCGSRARLYTACLDKKMNVYELGSGDLLLSLIFDVPLTAIAVNICESELFVGTTTGEIFQCNLHNFPREVRTEEFENSNSRDKEEEKIVFKAHKSHVTALSVSVDCRTLVSGSTDKMVHIWDIGSQQVLRTIEHKGPVTAAFFATGFENFRASTLKPRLELCSFQTNSTNEEEIAVKVISRGRNPMDILDFKSYIDNNSANSSSQESEKVKTLQEEIERLKSINTAMYQYSVKYILNDLPSTTSTI